MKGFNAFCLVTIWLHVLYTTFCTKVKTEQSPCRLFKTSENFLKAEPGSQLKLTFTVPKGCFPSDRSELTALSINTKTASMIKEVICQLVNDDQGKCHSSQSCHCSRNATEYRIGILVPDAGQLMYQIVGTFSGNGSFKVAVLDVFTIQVVDSNNTGSTDLDLLSSTWAPTEEEDKGSEVTAIASSVVVVIIIIVIICIVVFLIIRRRKQAKAKGYRSRTRNEGVRTERVERVPATREKQLQQQQGHRDRLDNQPYDPVDLSYDGVMVRYCSPFAESGRDTTKVVKKTPENEPKDYYVINEIYENY